jgi:hypothetical protein
MEEAKKGRFTGPALRARRQRCCGSTASTFERSYVYGPENADLRAEGPAMLGGAATTNLYRMDSTVDGNPIGWTIRTLGTKLPRMLGARAIRRLPSSSTWRR